MNLWILKARENLLDSEDSDNPWNPPWDKNYGVVVRAETERRARELAQAEGKDETKAISVWLDPQYTTCEKLDPLGDEGVLLIDNWAG